MRHPDHLPPAVARKLMATLLPDHVSILGDMEEEYFEIYESWGRSAAVRYYWAQVLRTIPSVLINDFLWQNKMIKSYFTVAFRQIRNHTGFSAINVLGLALSMSVGLLVIALISGQSSFDIFHKDSDRVYRITTKEEQSFGKISVATSSAMLGPELMRQTEEIENLVQMSRSGGSLATEALTVEYTGIYSDPAFFELFNFPLKYGDPASALSNPYSIVLTSEKAEELFGTTNPVGQSVHREGTGALEITGVFDELNPKTHLRFDVVLSLETLRARVTKESDFGLGKWSDNTSFYNYIKVAENANVERIEELATLLGAEHHNSTTREEPKYSLQPVTGINLGPDHTNQIARVFSGISAMIFSIYAALLMLVAIINYITLSASRSLQRAKEVGIRKVLGAGRGQIIKQSVSEAVMLALIALVIASIMFFWLVDQFNNLAFARRWSALISVGDLDIKLWLVFLGFALTAGVLAGILPAVNMSRFVPVRVLNGPVVWAGKHKLTGRKVLVVFQFSLSIVAIVTTAVIYKQARFIMEADYGFDQEQLVHLNLGNVNYETLRTELLRIPGITEIAATSSVPAAGSVTQNTIEMDGFDRPLLIQHLAVDEHFLDQYKLSVVAGRNFDSNLPGDRENSLVLTEAALDLLGFSSPDEAVGSMVNYEPGFADQKMTIIGVSANIYSQGFEDGYVPVAMTLEPDLYNYVAIRIAPLTITETLSALDATWRSIAPTVPISFSFFDEQLRARNAQFTDTITLLGIFSFLLIAIACMGLLGMASFSASRRIREVGIRKVMGAKARDVIILLSREYLMLVVWAIALAAPLSWILGAFILQNFANSISMTPWLLLASVAPIVGLALLAIGSQTWRAAVSNPVDSIQQE